MKLTKILAMLLSLCMILCCFAACGGDDDAKDDDKDEKVEEKDEDDDDDKKSEDDEDDKKSEEDEDDEDDKSDKDDDKDAVKAEGIEGKWEGAFDYADLLKEKEGIDVDGSLMFEFTFEFNDDGEYALAGKAPDQEDVEKFAEAYTDAAVEMLMDNMGADDKDELAESLGYDSYDEFFEEGYEGCLDELEGQVENMDVEGTGSYEYEDNVLLLDGAIEFEIDLDGDAFAVEDVSDANLAILFGGVEFERQ